MKDRIGQEVKEGDFILYVTKSEAPSIQFAWVEEIKEEWGENRDREPYLRGLNVKIHHAEPDGTRKNKTVWTSGEWDDIENRYLTPSYYRDTGKPSTVWLSSGPGQDNRLLVTKPI